jgi:hypothetical protein
MQLSAFYPEFYKKFAESSGKLAYLVVLYSSKVLNPQGKPVYDS